MSEAGVEGRLRVDRARGSGNGIRYRDLKGSAAGGSIASMCTASTTGSSRRLLLRLLGQLGGQHRKGEHAGGHRILADGAGFGGGQPGGRVGAQRAQAHGAGEGRPAVRLERQAGRRAGTLGGRTCVDAGQHAVHRLSVQPHGQAPAVSSHLASSCRSAGSVPPRTQEMPLAAQMP